MIYIKDVLKTLLQEQFEQYLNANCSLEEKGGKTGPGACGGDLPEEKKSFFGGLSKKISSLTSPKKQGTNKENVDSLSSTRPSHTFSDVYSASDLLNSDSKKFYNFHEQTKKHIEKIEERVKSGDKSPEIADELKKYLGSLDASTKAIKNKDFADKQEWKEEHEKTRSDEDRKQSAEDTKKMKETAKKHRGKTGGVINW